MSQLDDFFEFETLRIERLLFELIDFCELLDFIERIDRIELLIFSFYLNFSFLLFPGGILFFW